MSVCSCVCVRTHGCTRMCMPMYTRAHVCTCVRVHAHTSAVWQVHRVRDPVCAGRGQRGPGFHRTSQGPQGREAEMDKPASQSLERMNAIQEPAVAGMCSPGGWAVLPTRRASLGVPGQSQASVSPSIKWGSLALCRQGRITQEGQRWQGGGCGCWLSSPARSLLVAELPRVEWFSAWRSSAVPSGREDAGGEGSPGPL